MGRMKEEFMQMKMQEQEQDMQDRMQLMDMTSDEAHQYLLEEQEQQEQEYINNVPDYEEEFINQNNLKMKKVANTKDTAEVKEVKETKKETLRRLFKENNLVEEDVYKDKRGFVIITRTGIDKIVSKQNIVVAYEPIVMQKDWVVLRGSATTEVNGTPRNVMSFGEASEDNLMGGAKKFPVAMAEKRAMSRCVLKISGLYEQGVFGQDEIVD